MRTPIRSGGNQLSQVDCLIAAAALAADAVLATGNPRHFPMSGIEVEHWPVGEQARRQPASLSLPQLYFVHGPVEHRRAAGLAEADEA